MIFPPSSDLTYYAGVDGGWVNYYLCAICADYVNEARIDEFEDGELYSDGWSPISNGEDFIREWLKENKPLCVEYKGHWRRCKLPTGKGYFYEKIPKGY